VLEIMRVQCALAILFSMLGVGITTTKFASQVVKCCGDSVCVENRVSEMKGYHLKRLL